MPPQRLTEALDGFACASDLDEDLAEQLRRRLHRLRQPQRRRQIELGFRRRLQRLDGVVAVAGRQLDQRGQLTLHDRDRRAQVAFVRRFRPRRETVAGTAGEGIVARARGADANREQIVHVGKAGLVRHHAPAARLDDEARTHRGQGAEERHLSG